MQVKRPERIPTALRILLVEDEPAIRELLQLSLHHHGFDVETAANAQEAQRCVSLALPDLAIIDWMLPGQSGLALAQAWRQAERTRELPIILLTARGTEADKVAGLEAGADDYMTKPFSPKELLARVRAVLRRRAPHLLSEVINIACLSLNPATHRLTVQGHVIDLGPTEFRLLCFLMTHPERVYSRAQLLDEVWGDHVFIEERTVDVHVRRLRAALEPWGAHLHIETVRGAGYCFRKVLSS